MTIKSIEQRMRDLIEEMANKYIQRRLGKESYFCICIMVISFLGNSGASDEEVYNMMAVLNQMYKKGFFDYEDLLSIKEYCPLFFFHLRSSIHNMHDRLINKGRIPFNEIKFQF